jgi:hypothetical protein
MIRSQIYLTENQINFLKRISFEKEVTMSEIVREALDEKLSYKKNKTNKNSGDLLLKIAGYAKLGKTNAPRDLASNVDKYLYR